MTKGLHKNSLRKGEPNKWIVEDIVEKIRIWVEERKKVLHSTLFNDEYNDFLSFLSDLEKEEKPMNPDDAMKELDEKIALVKQRGTWDGVDVDKYMDEVRGREPEKPINLEDIDTEIGHWIDHLDDKYCLLVPHYSIQDLKDTARHFVQWGAEHARNEMMKETVEGCVTMYANKTYPTLIGIRERIGDTGDKVKLIIVKED